jgi:hypothetical protein
MLRLIQDAIRPEETEPRRFIVVVITILLPESYL